MRIDARRMLNWLMAALLLIGSVGAQAATYVINYSGNANNDRNWTNNVPCSGSWSRDDSVYTCSGTVALSGDTVTLGASAASRYGSMTFVANAGFSLTNSTLGSTSNPIHIRNSWGQAQVSGSTLYGTTTVTGGLTATNTRFVRTVTVSGTSNFNGGSLSANLQAGSSVTTTNGTTIAGTLTNESWGTINLSGGQVSGNVNVAGNMITSGGTVLGGTLTASGDVNLSGGSVGGQVSGTSIQGTSTVFDGNLVATNGIVTVTGGSVSGAISSNCCQVTLTRTTVTGNVTVSQNNIILDETTLTGSLSTTNEVRLNNGSFVYGNVTAGTWSGTITGTDGSHVYGVCNPTATNPSNLCDGEVKPSCLTSSADGFARTSLGDDWAVTYRSGSFGAPRIVNGRLRLTDDSTEASTGATVQRLFPASNNLITITFRYYGYSSKSNRGADGMALILSDASATPQPGAFGGSLGYAQKTGIPGFAGGWLGIGLDEFGNFSNATEGRVGGVGSRSDSVSIRGSGSGTSGYAYLTGTSTLSTGIDNASATSTASPGHLYRITVDSRSATKTWVTVERDTGGTGNNYSTLVPAYDVRANGSQGAVPSNFMLSFTGSTGSNVNIHELDQLQVCANRMNTVGTQIDHFEIAAPATGLTCSPMTVTVKACMNAACSLYTEAVTATATLSNGDTLLSSDTQSFTGGSGGFSLGRTSIGSGTLDIASSTPAAKPFSQTLCQIGTSALGINCTVSFVDSGFVFDVPTQLSNKLSDDVMIKAVRKSDTSQQCVPAFQNVSHDLTFWSAYIEPTSSAGRVLEVNNTAVSTTEGAPTTLRLRFDSNAQAPIQVRYNDAGKLRLNARYSGSAANKDAGLVMSGSDDFVVKPVGFCVKPTAWNDATTTTCAKGDASCSAFIAAGDGFPVRFRPVGWQADTDDDLCVGNPTTPNFRHGNLALDTVLVAPVGGAAGTLSLFSSNESLDGQQKYAHLTTTTGYSGSAAEVVQQVKFSEVGVMQMRVTPAAAGYLDGETVNGGRSTNIGRITPAYLQASGTGMLANACSNGITYQAQPMRISSLPSLTLTGQSRSGTVTTNYDRDAFWRFGNVWAPLYFSSTDRAALNTRAPASGQPASLDCALDANKVNCVATRLGADGTSGTVKVLDTSIGDGSMTLQVPDKLTLRYLRAPTPTADDRPFDAKVEVFTPRAQLVDADGIFVAVKDATYTPIDFGYAIEGAQVVLGRYRLAGATGSELSPLNMPLYLERWNGTGFITDTELADANCTAVTDAALDNPTGNLSVSETSATVGAGVQGLRLLSLSAPGAGNAGSIRVTPSVAGWLYFDWLGSGASNPSATATFGGYAGSRPLIFRREIYR